jgi:hypothetical protein
METAREAIRTLEAVLADAEDAGMDTRLSRQSLVLARHHLAMGRHEKALACCRSAEDEIR